MDTEQAVGENPSYSKDELDRIGRVWIEKIEASERREKRWIDQATAAEAAYLADDSEYDGALPSFNILHCNVETIVPAIYNSTPQPDIRPRHNSDDPTSREVTEMLERTISTQIDDSALDSEIEASTQDGFMAGRGIVRLKFNADEVPAQMGIAQDVDPNTGEMVEREVVIAPARMANERVTYEVVSWRDYREGPAKRWNEVPWIAMRHEITEAERERLTQPEIADTREAEEQRAVDEAKECSVWEVWCKESGQVYLVIEDGCEVISILDDPLGLSGFFPVAKPVQPITATGKRCPVTPYAIYEKLAKELDTATKRIDKIMGGLKVRGAIAADADIVELLANVGDNEIVPVPNIENIAAAGGLSKAIMWWPVDMAITVLQQLYTQREQTKQAIYELTGISDIVRGQGAASETATAQQIKTQWGALRIKKMQRLVERQVRELFIMTAEIISLQFSPEAIQKASGMQITPEAMQYLQRPLDHYRIDVESDSTVRADLTKNRSEMSEFLQGTAQFFSTMQPVVQAAPEAAAPLAKMYASFARQFDLGKAGEDAVEQFAKMAEKQANQPQQPSPEQQAMQAEMQMKQQEQQARMAADQAKLQLEQQKLQLQVANLQLTAQGKAAELQIKEAETGIKAEKVQIDGARGQVEAAAMAAEIEIEMDQERAARIGN